MTTQEAFEAWHDADTLGGPDCDMREIEAIAFAAGAAWAARECAQIADDAGLWVQAWEKKYGNVSIADAIRARFPEAFK